MPRQTTDQPITTRNARKQLAIRAEPYWRGLEAGVAIGYRKSAAGGGTWIGRVVVDGRYREGSLGRADDGIEEEGVTFLDYSTAMRQARKWATDQFHKAAGKTSADSSRSPYTIADALNDYLAAYAARGGKGLAQTKTTVNAHILPSLGGVRVDRLTRQRLSAWRDALASEAPRLRSAKGANEPRRRALDPNDADASRRRRASANRVLSTLKAALNHAYAEGRVSSKPWEGVKPFKQADEPKVRFLTDVEIVRLANACGAELRAIVTAALLTGMRYGEIIRMRVADFGPEAGTITVPVSKSGQARHIYLTDEGKEFFAQSVAGKAADAYVFTRDSGTPWGKSHQHRPLQEACSAAKISPAISYHILRHTYASRLAMRSTPMPVIAAQLGHKGTRMTERHYAHLGPSYVGDMVRKQFGELGILSDTNVTPMPTVRGSTRRNAA